ncbi:uncharacterized protein LOC143195747 [Rhynchophorus ferrugineus]|uniref:C2H2-type domain-containing protein n=1 Tax=Rhynchophorus ferrugineus TaxID=354439 RepID=A0A834IRM3_RHYFE|nr:hypothetical protein GWI33_008130 [Rhynchophorus ferrugineus]
MNFSPFGSHFSSSIPGIHQFAAKLTQDVSSSPFPNPQDDLICNNRYTANGIPTFTQHHHAPQQLVPNSTKNNGNYLNSQNVYSQQNSVRRQGFEQQGFELFQNRTQPDKLGPGSDLHKKKEHELSLKHPHQIIQNNNHHSSSSTAVLSNAWQSLTASSSTVADYLSQLPTSTLPLSLHEFLKYSAETLKKDTISQPIALQGSNEGGLNLLNNGAININPLNIGNTGNSTISTNSVSTLSNLTTINTAHLQSNPGTTKKKKKKKPEKEKKPKPKPGEIRLSTALDGSTLYCCPECHMALPERDLLEQHMMGHNMERRFVCDICGAALKRKDHLTRHKQSHNPERPFVCSVCLKAFKRKEQLTLHFVIHSGEKRHVCSECGKGFYRKDHLRKHTRSHIARRVKAELSQQGTGVHITS